MRLNEPSEPSARSDGMSEEPSAEHTRPDQASDAHVAVAGKMSEALECLERARGHLYSFHQLMGQPT